MLYHVRPPSKAARTLSAEDEQFVQHSTLTDNQTVAATQQAYTAAIRSDKIKPLLMQATQTMVIKLGLQREALADLPHILQRLMAALFFDMPQPTVEDALRRLSPEGAGNDSFVFRQMISRQLRVHMSVALS
eukprot:1141925-Pleurochrysis_carterae.AAC.1